MADTWWWSSVLGGFVGSRPGPQAVPLQKLLSKWNLQNPGLKTWRCRWYRQIGGPNWCLCCLSNTVIAMQKWLPSNGQRCCYFSIWEPNSLNPSFSVCLPSVCLPHCLSALMRAVPEAMQEVANADVAVGDVKHFFTIGRSENKYSHYRNQCGSSLKS